MTAAITLADMPEATSGADILDRVESFLGRFVAYPDEHARVADALWIVHTHAMAAWESTPRIAFLSPEPASGKTRALEVTELLVPRPVEAVNVTAAYLFRKVGDPAGASTLLYDEIDTVFGPRAKENEDIRGLLNAGHRRGAVAGRCVVRGKTIETEEIPAYAAVALAGLGALPDTILSRSIVVRMQRRAPSEHIEPFRRRDSLQEGTALRDEIAGWAAIEGATLEAARPAMPGCIVSRIADPWEALLAIADAAAGEWPERARVSAVSLVSLSKASTPSLGIRLLSDICFVWSTTEFKGIEVFFSKDLLDELLKLDEAPWTSLRNDKPLDQRGLAQRLRDYGVKPKQVRNGSVTAKGYERADFADAWARYVPLPEEGKQGKQGKQNGAHPEDSQPCLDCAAPIPVSWVVVRCEACHEKFMAIPPDPKTARLCRECGAVLDPSASQYVVICNDCALPRSHAEAAS